MPRLWSELDERSEAGQVLGMKERFECDTVIIGAGVIGLACAAAIGFHRKNVVVLEAEERFGQGTSSRNSEVIHAGIYYEPASLKQMLCVDGRRKLYKYMIERGVKFAKIGKLIVATDSVEAAALEGLIQRGLNNDVESLSLLSRAKARALEPALSCTLAIHSGETGIVDSHGLMQAMLREANDHGVSVVYKSQVASIEIVVDGFDIVLSGESDVVLHSRELINAAGLNALALARSIVGFDTAFVPRGALAKGSYYGCAGKAFSRLVYPMPANGGLGVHLTLNLGGGMRFGPDVEWLDHEDPLRVDYRVDPARADIFYEAIRRYWPGLPDKALSPDYAGCRPKLSGRGEPVADFRIDGPSRHGVAGLVNLFGIESPGLTASLAIAEYAVARLNELG